MTRVNLPEDAFVGVGGWGGLTVQKSKPKTLGKSFPDDAGLPSRHLNLMLYGSGQQE